MENTFVLLYFFAVSLFEFSTPRHITAVQRIWPSINITVSIFARCHRIALDRIVTLTFRPDFFSDAAFEKRSCIFCVPLVPLGRESANCCCCGCCLSTGNWKWSWNCDGHCEWQREWEWEWTGNLLSNLFVNVFFLLHHYIHVVWTELCRPSNDKRSTRTHTHSHTYALLDYLRLTSKSFVSM